MLAALLARLSPRVQSAYVVRCGAIRGRTGWRATVVDHSAFFRCAGTTAGRIAYTSNLAGLRRPRFPVRRPRDGPAYRIPDPALRARKLDRDNRSLTDLTDRRRSVRALQPGPIAVERQDWPTALGISSAAWVARRRRFDRAQAVRPDRTMPPDARRHPAALGACAEGLRLDPDDAELHFRKAVLHRKAGHPAEAAACWRRILTLKRPPPFLQCRSRHLRPPPPCATSPF